MAHYANGQVNQRWESPMQNIHIYKMFPGCQGNRNVLRMNIAIQNRICYNASRQMKA